MIRTKGDDAYFLFVEGFMYLEAVIFIPTQLKVGLHVRAENDARIKVHVLFPLMCEVILH